MQTTEQLDAYELFHPVRALRELIDDLSTWYLRRSRDRIKEGDSGAKQTLYDVLKTLAQVMAPFAPFAAEDLWQKLKKDTDVESVHLAAWPEVAPYDEKIISDMEAVRKICTLGNALRKKENIPVRQPLAKLEVANLQLEDEYKMLITEELNVKDVVLGTETKLDTVITSELKAEGNYRELVRAVQDLRKAQGLTPSDTVALVISPAAEALLSLFMADFTKTVQATKCDIC